MHYLRPGNYTKAGPEPSPEAGAAERADWLRLQDEEHERWEKDCDAAHAALMTFAARMEELGFADHNFTANLHTAACRLRDQERARGQVAADAEWWTERVMQMFKAVLDGRKGSKIAETVANSLLLLTTWKRFAAKHGLEDFLSARYPDWAAGNDPKAKSALYDNVIDEHGSRMMGKGRKCKGYGNDDANTLDGLMLASLARGLERYIRTHIDLPGAWLAACPAARDTTRATKQNLDKAERFLKDAAKDGRVLVFTRCVMRGGEYLYSRNYKKMISRQNYSTRVQYERDAPWVLLIDYCVLLRHPANAAAISSKRFEDVDGTLDVRMAVGVLYDAIDVTRGHCGHDAGDTAITSDITQVLKRTGEYDGGRLHAVLLSQIDCKLAGWWPNNAADVDSLFMPFTNISRLL